MQLNAFAASHPQTPMKRVNLKSKRTQGVFDALPDAVFFIDPLSMRFIEVNRAGCMSLGYSPEELLAKGPKDFCPPEDLGPLLKQLDAFATAESPTMVIRTSQIHRNGVQIPVEWHLSKYCGEGVELWLVISRELRAGERDNRQENLDDAVLGRLGHDPLTGLPDRRLFIRRLQKALTSLSDSDGELFAVCFVDLDNFKSINDREGHLMGDGVLCEVAARLSKCVRPSDTVARFGGDEFTILVEHLHDEADASIVAMRILSELKRPVILGGRAISVAASIGVVASSTGRAEIQNLLDNADRAMYRAKALGGACFAFFSADEPSHSPNKPR